MLKRDFDRRLFTVWLAAMVIATCCSSSERPTEPPIIAFSESSAWSRASAWRVCSGLGCLRGDALQPSHLSFAYRWRSDGSSADLEASMSAGTFLLVSGVLAIARWGLVLQRLEKSP